MFWLLAYASVSAVSISVLAWLFHGAPIFDENERPTASSAKTAAPRGDVRMGPRVAALNKRAGALALGLNSGRPLSRYRSFRLTGEVRSFRLTR
jgi:hypothetical protein